MAEQMKESGIQWIGIIPYDWNVERIKHIVQNNDNGIKVGPFGSALTNEVVSSDEGKYKVYGQSNLIRKDFSYGDNYVSEQNYKRLINYEVLPNDIAVSMMGTIGKCSVVPDNIEPGIMDSHLIKIRLSKKMLPRYFEYAYESDMGYSQLLFNSKGSIMNGLNSAIVKGVYIPVPGILEQQSIADFLDKECAQIDSIAADLEKQIELLQQYKKSLITETVTKGLDKSVLMKDSGVEWIGKIPEHWNVEPIKYRVTFHNGDRGENYPTKSELQSEGIPFINAGHLEGDGLNMDNMDYISEEKYRIMGGVKLRSGDILYCLRGSVGKNAIVDMNQGTVASSLVAIRSVRISAKYLYYCLNSHIEEVQRYLWDNGTAQPNLSADNLGKYKFCIPPVEEQKAIVKYLNNICSQIDNLVIGKKKQLSTIQQHKKSLIYEYVTGKKRVKEVR